MFISSTVDSVKAGLIFLDDIVLALLSGNFEKIPSIGTSIRSLLTLRIEPFG